MLYILYILHLQSFTYTYSFILYVDIAVLHVDLHKSICMYVNMNYALVYTNLNPICFVLHFIHVYIYIHIVYYISMLSKHACALHTHTHTCACEMMPQAEFLFFTIMLKPPDLSISLHFLLCTQSKLTTLFISNNKIKEIRLKVLILKYMKVREESLYRRFFSPRLDLRNQSSFTRLQFGRKFVYLIIPIFMICICIRMLYIYVIFVHIYIEYLVWPEEREYFGCSRIGRNSTSCRLIRRGLNWPEFTLNVMSRNRI